MEEKAVIYATEGKGADTIREFKDELPLHYAHPSDVGEFSVDMSPSFISGINKNFHWAVVTFDRFHVVKMINEAIDKTRREEQKGILDLKSTRFIWLKNQANLTEKQKEKLDLLSQSNLKTGKAYRMKLAMNEIYETATDRIDASIRKITRLLTL
jgi:transposase